MGYVQIVLQDQDTHTRHIAEIHVFECASGQDNRDDYSRIRGSVCFHYSPE